MDKREYLDIFLDFQKAFNEVFPQDFLGNKIKMGGKRYSSIMNQ